VQHDARDEAQRRPLDVGAQLVGGHPTSLTLLLECRDTRIGEIFGGARKG
jgi:hypothetical protein